MKQHWREWDAVGGPLLARFPLGGLGKPPPEDRKGRERRQALTRTVEPGSEE